MLRSAKVMTAFEPFSPPAVACLEMKTDQRSMPRYMMKSMTCAPHQRESVSKIRALLGTRESVSAECASEDRVIKNWVGSLKWGRRGEQGAAAQEPSGGAESITCATRTSNFRFQKLGNVLSGHLSYLTECI